MTPEEIAAVLGLTPAPAVPAPAVPAVPTVPAAASPAAGALASRTAFASKVAQVARNLPEHKGGVQYVKFDADNGTGWTYGRDATPIAENVNLRVDVEKMAHGWRSSEIRYSGREKQPAVSEWVPVTEDVPDPATLPALPATHEYREQVRIAFTAPDGTEMIFERANIGSLREFQKLLKAIGERAAADLPYTPVVVLSQGTDGAKFYPRVTPVAWQ